MQGETVKGIERREDAPPFNVADALGCLSLHIAKTFLRQSPLQPRRLHLYPDVLLQVHSHPTIVVRGDLA